MLCLLLIPRFRTVFNLYQPILYPILYRRICALVAHSTLAAESRKS